MLFRSGIDAITPVLERLGFGQKSGVDLLGRVRSWAKSGHILTPRKGGKISGPWVKVYGRTVYVNDLIRKYIVSVPGMV